MESKKIYKINKRIERLLRKIEVLHAICLEEVGEIVGEIEMMEVAGKKVLRNELELKREKIEKIISLIREIQDNFLVIMNFLEDIKLINKRIKKFD